MTRAGRGVSTVQGRVPGRGTECGGKGGLERKAPGRRRERGNPIESSGRVCAGNPAAWEVNTHRGAASGKQSAHLNHEAVWHPSFALILSFTQSLLL